MTTNSIKKRIYFTPQQRSFVGSNAKTTVWVGSRGSGKTRCIGFRLLRITGGCQSENIPPMQGCKGILVGIDYAQLEAKELPEILATLRSVGYQPYTKGAEITHPFWYVYGVEPPAFFDKTRTPPESYKHVLTLSNGCCLELISMRQKDGVRGGSYDFVIVAEAAYINGNAYATQIKPMLRGVMGKYKSPYYLSETITTSMPWTSRGQWVFNYEKIAADNPNIIYINSNIYDCQAIYGLSTIEQWKKEICAINPHIWEVEYMNKRATRPSNAYYKNLSAEKHFYINITGNNDPYYNDRQALYIAFDFNSYLYTQLVAQYDGLTLSVQNEFFSSVSLFDMLEHFCNRYESHYDKTAYLYGDVNGYYMRTDNQNDIAGYDAIKSYLSNKGWFVSDEINYKPNPEHHRRYANINDALNEQENTSVLIRINENNCPFTCISLEATPINEDFTKDKSSESQKDIDQRTATHASDAFDYIAFRVIEESSQKNSFLNLPGL